MDQITHDVRSSQWLEVITQCQNRQEGITAKQWMADNGISENRITIGFENSGSRLILI